MRMVGDTTNASYPQEDRGLRIDVTSPKDSEEAYVVETKEVTRIIY